MRFLRGALSRLGESNSERQREEEPLPGRLSNDGLRGGTAASRSPPSGHHEARPLGITSLPSWHHEDGVTDPWSVGPVPRGNGLSSARRSKVGVPRGVRADRQREQVGAPVNSRVQVPSGGGPSARAAKARAKPSAPPPWGYSPDRSPRCRVNVLVAPRRELRTHDVQGAPLLLVSASQRPGQHAAIGSSANQGGWQ